MQRKFKFFSIGLVTLSLALSPIPQIPNARAQDPVAALALGGEVFLGEAALFVLPLIVIGGAATILISQNVKLSEAVRLASLETITRFRLTPALQKLIESKAVDVNSRIFHIGPEEKLKNWTRLESQVSFIPAGADGISNALDPSLRRFVESKHQMEKLMATPLFKTLDEIFKGLLLSYGVNPFHGHTASEISGTLDQIRLLGLNSAFMDDLKKINSLFTEGTHETEVKPEQNQKMKSFFECLFLNPKGQANLVTLLLYSGVTFSMALLSPLLIKIGSDGTDLVSTLLKIYGFIFSISRYFRGYQTIVFMGEILDEIRSCRSQTDYSSDPFMKVLREMGAATLLVYGTMMSGMVILINYAISREEHKQKK